MTEITNFTTLSSAAEEAAGRAMITGAITLATAEINRLLRVREMLVEVTQATATLPSDFLEAETVKVADVVYSPSRESAQARSGVYMVHDGTLKFTPEETAPDLFLRYYGKLDVLSGTNTNDVLDTYPEIYLYGLLAHHAQLVRDDAGVSYWRPLFIDAIGDANRHSAMSQMGSLTMRPVAPRSA